MNILSALRLLTEVNPWKTVYFNFHYFPLKTAIRMPFFIYWRTKLYKTNGSIQIDAPIRTGMVKFGAYALGTQDMLYSRTMWDVFGTLIVKGPASIGRGSKISIGQNAVLTLGNNFNITGRTEIICHKQISFGNDCLLLWDNLIMDTDFHIIRNEEGQIINPPRQIAIGNHVWVGCRNTILKGVSIANGCIVSANSTITQSFADENCIIGGHGKMAGIIRKNIDWEV